LKKLLSSKVNDNVIGVALIASVFGFACSLTIQDTPLMIASLALAILAVKLDK
jgi:hypothetical protein